VLCPFCWCEGDAQLCEIDTLVETGGRAAAHPPLDVVEQFAYGHCGAHVCQRELVTLIERDERVALTVVQDEARGRQLQLPRVRRLGHAAQPVHVCVRRKRVLWRDTRPAVVFEREQRRLLVGDGALEGSGELGPSAEQLGT
jgi:hypothetical protein